MSVHPSTVSAVRPDERPRVLEVEGMHNFRDVGGYPLTSGGMTRWGVLFRGGSLHGMTKATRDRLSALGIRTVVDLREAIEFEDGALPDVADAPVRLNNPIFRERAFATEAGDLELLYLQILEQCAEEIVSAVELLAQPDALPAVVHCSAGKDRTGLVIGLTLSALGVSDEVVARDYGRTAELLTDELRAHIARKGERLGMNAQKLAMLMGSPPHVLRAILAVLREQYGDTAGYLRAHGLRVGTLDALREQLVALP